MNIRNALSNAFVGGGGGGADATKLPLTGGTLTGPLTITGGTVTTSTPIFVQTQTWNGGTVAFKTNTLNVVNTASKAYSSTWADVSTSFEIQDSGVAKLALIPKGSENFSMLRIGGADGAHALLKDSGTGGIIFRRSDGIDSAVIGHLNNQIGLCVAASAFGGAVPGVIGFNGATSFLSGGNSVADAFFQRGGAAACIQMGSTSATPVNQLFIGPSGSGTNIVGGKLSIGPGKSTGNATPATLVLQGTAAGSSGTTAQTLVDVLTVVREGVVRITNIPTSSAGLSTGDIYSNAGILTIV